MTASKPDLRVAASVLNSAAVGLLRSLRNVDRPAGITPARLSALSVLVFGGPSTLGALAAAEGVAGPTMTRIVDGLIADGFAERQPHPADGRAVLLAATESGDAVMRAAQQRRVDAITAGLASLPAATRRALVSSAPMLDELTAAVRLQSAGHRPAIATASAPAGIGPSGARQPGGDRTHGRSADAYARREAARVRWAEATDQLSAAARRTRGS